ncbi:MAG: response regulator [Vicinamibacteria bacterium]|nr:response regulator [Vicinamibacteria bacterium]
MQSAPAVTQTDIHNVITEIHDLRRMQAEILQMQSLILAQLKSPARSTAEAVESSELRAPSLDNEDLSDEAPKVPRVRRRRKSALVVDDDPETMKAAVAALEQAQVPLRTATNGNDALAALAEEKPDVLVVDLAIGEPMPGKDLINMVKSTMEWVDIPIVFYTRHPIESREEARSVHGGDEFVLKGPGSAEALVNRVIKVFQQHHS